MTHLMSIPENVLIQLVFPCLDHNDILRLRRVSKQTKAYADTYLWTLQPGHQGNWELEIDSSKEDKTLEAFLQKRLPPPSRLHIVNKDVKEPSEQKSIFEDEHLEEFIKRYSKYVTTLRLDKLFFPLTSAKEIGFYESLVKLKMLRCEEMITVGGAAQFEEKTRRAEGSFLIRPTWSKKLKIFKLDETDCMDSMWNFINGISNNLDELFHPFVQRNQGYNMNDVEFNRNNLAPVQQLIERRAGMKSRSKFVYNWNNLLLTSDSELLRMFAICRDNGVVIKISGDHLDSILYDENGRVDRRRLVGSIIHSLHGNSKNDAVFFLELPALEDIFIHLQEPLLQMPANGYPEWPNLREMVVLVRRYTKTYLHFLDGGLKLPKLEKLILGYGNEWKKRQLPIPRNLGVSCGNVKKLTLIGCPGDNRFFLGLWKGLPLLENVTLYECYKLTNKGFVGDGVGGRGPAFLNLKKLKHLSIYNLEEMPRVTDAVFRSVFRHLKLSSFRLASDKAIRSITITGLKELLTGPFEETIVKLDLAQLQLENVSEERLKQVMSCFRSSKML